MIFRQRTGLTSGKQGPRVSEGGAMSAQQRVGAAADLPPFGTIQAPGTAP